MNTTQDGQQPVIVLLAEDEALVRMMAADVLREEGGFKVVEVVNADEALTVLEATADVRALVTDVEMPGSLDGFTLARVVKQAWPHIGIVVTSGRMAPGPNDLPSGALFIPKPYRPADLVAAVQTVLPSNQTQTPAEAPISVLPSAIKTVSPTPALARLVASHSPFPSRKNSVCGAVPAQVLAYCNPLINWAMPIVKAINGRTG
jgi:CheY-like chemotaxis protein